jgi:AraC-like DNA-binding protein
MALSRQYEEQLPDRALRRVVSCYWRFAVKGDAGEFLDHFIPPDGGVVLSVVGTGDSAPYPATCGGPFVAPRVSRVAAGDWVLGIRLWPGAARACLQVDPRELVNRSIPLAGLIPSLSSRLEALAGGDVGVGQWAGMLDQHLPEHLDTAELDARVGLAVDIVLDRKGAVRVTELADLAGLSARQLRRLFRGAVGLPPKELARIVRLRSALIDAVLEDASLGQVAYEMGYADQAHMARDFRSLMGKAPLESQNDLRSVEHGWILREPR